MTVRCVAYCRVSSESQAGEKQTSLADQRRAIEALAAKLGHAVPDDGWFVDAGFSGGTAKGRPAFQKLLDFCASNERGQRSPGLVLALNSSRWGRFVDPSESQYWTFHLQRSGWFVQFVEGDSIADPKLRSIVRVLESTQSSAYRENLSANVRRGVRGAASQGFATHHAAFGYARKVVYPPGRERILARGVLSARDEKTVFVADEAGGEATYTRTLFSRYASGRWSLHALVTAAVTEWPARKWTRSVLSKMFRNRAYLGIIEGGVRLEHRTRAGGLGLGDATPYGCVNAHEPLISADTFEVVNRRLDEQRVKKARPRSPYAVSGLILCTGCNGPYVGAGINGGGNAQYKCRGRMADRYTCPTPGTTITSYLLEGAVVDVLAKYMARPSAKDAVRSAIVARLDALSAAPAPDTASIETEIRALTEQRERLVLALRNGTASEADLATGFADVRRKLNALEAARASAERHSIRPSFGPADRERLVAMAEQLPSLIRELKGAELRRVVEPWIRGATYDRSTRRLVLQIRMCPQTAEFDSVSRASRMSPAPDAAARKSTGKTAAASRSCADIAASPATSE